MDPVLIVGGGLVGLTSSLLLSHYGVPSVLVERHAGTSPQPKARRLTFRSVEVFRSMGLESAIVEVGRELADFEGMRSGPSLVSSTEMELFTPGEWEELLTYSPCDSALTSQDRLEPELRRLAVERGGDLRFSSELAGLTQDASGVTAVVEGATIRASYVIGADGARSPVRSMLGVPRSGRGRLGKAVTVDFRADLTELVRGKEFNLCMVEGPAAGTFASVNGSDRWIYLADAQPLSDDGWAARIREALGADVQVEVLSVLSWEPSMRVADAFSVGRVFLAGDAAHVMPPYLALGANTGIQDAHNLAWKLAAVLSGEASPEVLSTYYVERHPVAYEAAAQSSLRIGSLLERSPDFADPLALVAGYQYPAGALVPDGLPPAPRDRLELSGRPGTRVPHTWLSPSVSTIDLVSNGWALLAADERWKAVDRVPVHQVSADWLPHGEAVLVRPDAIVAWRSGPVPDPAGTVASVLGRLLCPPRQSS